MADDGFKLFVYAIAGFIAGIALFIKGLIMLKKRRFIENMPTSKVRSIAMGIVEIYGAVKPYEGRLLKSPLLQKACIYYDMMIQEMRGSGKNAHWVTIRSATDMIPFILEDETGKVLVDPKGSKVDFKKDLDYTTGFGNDYLPLTAKEYMKNNNLMSETFLGIGKSIKCTETIISPKDMLYILGTAGKNPYVKKATALKSEDAIMIQAGNNKNSYFIADKSEKDIVKGLKWGSIAGIFGGAALSVVCLAAIFLFIGVF